MSVLSSPRKTISLIIVWVILLTVVWFASPSLTRYGLRLSATLPHRNVATQLSGEERDAFRAEIAEVQQRILEKKQQGKSDFAGEYLALGIAYEKIGAYAKAYDSLVRITEKETMNSSAWMYLARTFEGLTLYKDAADAWRSTIEADSDNSGHYARLGVVLDQRLNDTFRANGVYLEGLIRAGNDPDLMRSYALFLERIGEKGTALLYWKALLE
ncbi:MAG: hypothetical protein AAB855_02535, partial [Patescibacteria group bacterium]